MKEPLILRAYGKGKVLEKTNSTFTEMLTNHFPSFTEQELRQIFVIDVESAQSSCGWGVPFMEYVEERSRLKDYSRKNAN
jgi:hypothetical protein